MANIRMEDWVVCPTINNVYIPPEQAGQSIKGKVYGHPRFEDGESVCSSRIVNVCGRVIHTESGSVYVLGEPNADYVAWCKEQGVHVPTDEEPIRIKG